MNPIQKEIGHLKINEDIPFKVLIPCVLFITAIKFILFLFELYDFFLPRWPAFHDFSEVFFHLESARWSIQRHLVKVEVK